MHSLYRYTAPPSTCGYLPQQRWRLEYEYVSDLSADEYLALMQENWRRFGHMLFRPNCSRCRMCKAIRVRVAEFCPTRSQRRARKHNQGAIELRIGSPTVTRGKLDLYDRYHAFQTDFKDWPRHARRDAESYTDSFVNHPFEVEEWCYYLEGRLIGVGYVDVLPGEPRNLAGLSAIYFYYEPDERDRSPGTWNVLCLIEEAARRGMPYVYLGYHVEGCRSMEYKATFVPNERREEDGVWRVYRSYTRV